MNLYYLFWAMGLMELNTDQYALGPNNIVSLTQNRNIDANLTDIDLLLESLGGLWV